MSEGLRNVLVLCGQNSVRSQMMEAFLRKHAGDRFVVNSAGMEASRIHPLTIRVMEEVGVSLEGHRSKSVREFLGRWNVHELIIVCARTERACPKLFPGALHRHFWPFPDPSTTDDDPDDALVAFRDVRDRIERRVLDWIVAPSVGPESVTR